MPFISVFLGGKIELVEDDLADFDDLLVRQLKVLICHGHFEVGVDKISESVHILVTDNRRKVRIAHGTTL